MKEYFGGYFGVRVVDNKDCMTENDSLSFLFIFLIFPPFSFPSFGVFGKPTEPSTDNYQFTDANNYGSTQGYMLKPTHSHYKTYPALREHDTQLYKIWLRCFRVGVAVKISTLRPLFQLKPESPPLASREARVSSFQKKRAARSESPTFQNGLSRNGCRSLASA